MVVCKDLISAFYPRQILGFFRQTGRKRGQKHDENHAKNGGLWGRVAPQQEQLETFPKYAKEVRKPSKIFRTSTPDPPKLLLDHSFGSGLFVY